MKRVLSSSYSHRGARGGRCRPYKGRGGPKKKKNGRGVPQYYPPGWESPKGYYQRKREQGELITEWPPKRGVF